MKDNSKILLIIPTFNEEESIIKTIAAINDYNTFNCTNYDLIVINDGSTDNTENILLNHEVPHIKLPYNMGIGCAVQTGYKYAKINSYDIAVQFDGDGQHDISYVKDIIEPIIQNNADYVVGSRFADKNTSEFKSSTSRRIGIKILSFFLNVLCGVKVKDATSGFRAANRNIINLFSNNYPIEYPEPIAPIKIKKNNYIVKEIPVKMNEREAGKSSIHT